MTYEEAMDGTVVSRAKALAEVRAHNRFAEQDFLAEVGDRPEYDTRDVLGWLGY